MNSHQSEELKFPTDNMDTVLIVDDEAVNVRLLLEILQHSYRLLVATNGLQTLKLLDKHRNIDLILLDVDMPGMSGFDVLNQIKQRPEGVELPVILVTGRNQAEDEAFGLAQGAADYISKPITAAVVQARIKTQLTLARAKLALTEKNHELEQALAQTQAAKQELTQFTAMISHELRTPLAILKCEIELLVDGIRKPNKTNLNSLLEEVEHFSRLIDDMFELVLSESRALNYAKEPCQLDQLVSRSVELFKHQFADNHIELTTTIAAPSEISALSETTTLSKVSVFADPQRIRQVIDNILNNSLKYTNSGGQLHIFAERDDNWAWVHFQDSSPGVDSGDMAKLFDRFFRVEKSRNRATGGAGLGLAICKTIITDHGGIIQAKPSPIGGLWISIGLPTHHELNALPELAT